MSWSSKSPTSGAGTAFGDADPTQVELKLGRTDSDDAPRQKRLPVVLGIVVVALAAWLVLSGGDTIRPGTQVDGVRVSLGLADRQGWVLLDSQTGDLRPGFPEPMVWHKDQLCIGLSRVDFGPDDIRPSLARCVPNSVRSALDEDGIVTVATVVAGRDTWHFVEAWGPIERLDVEVGDGKGLDSDRIYTAGSTFALRLLEDQDLAQIEWRIGDVTYQCTPGPDAWRTSEFCVVGRAE